MLFPSIPLTVKAHNPPLAVDAPPVLLAVGNLVLYWLVHRLLGKVPVELDQAIEIVMSMMGNNILLLIRIEYLHLFLFLYLPVEAPHSFL